jgi:environmental stress-induced protein Ves
MSEPIRFADLVRSPWPNGAGRKADIAAGPVGADGMPDWLLAFAWLDAEAPFSDYGGFDRTITLASGVAFVLDFGSDGPQPLVVDAPFRPTPFDGGLPVRCVLPAGPCLVLNVMTRRARFRHEVAIVSTRVPLPPAAGERFGVVLRGRCAIEGRVLDPRDAVKLGTGVRLAAAAEALLAVVTILPADR